MASEDRAAGFVADFAIVPAVGDTAAPTIAEITAGVRLECVASSLDTPRSANVVDISAVCDQESLNTRGTVDNGPITLEVFREFDGVDAGWAALVEGDTAKFLVVCRAGFTGAAGIPAVADIVDVYPVQVVTRSPETINRSDGQAFTATLSQPATPAFDSVVAA